LGTDGLEGEQGNGWLGILARQTVDIFKRILARYAEIGKHNPSKTIVISSVVHPPETLASWDLWADMHRIAEEYAFESITSLEALSILQK
jgi:hypothetical protein